MSKISLGKNAGEEDERKQDRGKSSEEEMKLERSIGAGEKVNRK